MDQKEHVLIFMLMMMTLIVSDIILQPLFMMQHQASIVEMIVFEIVMMSIASIVGVKVSTKLEFHIWKKSSDIHKVFAIGTICTLINMGIYYFNRDQVVQWMPFMATLTPMDAIALSVRAAIQEEIIYRLCVMSVFVLVLRNFKIDFNHIVVVAAILSSILFGLNHPGFFIAFSHGLVLCYVYYKNGLLPAMMIHFFADAGPFLLLSIINRTF